MRRGISFLALLLLLLLWGAVFSADAMDVMLGRIVSIDRPGGTMMVTPLGEERTVRVAVPGKTLPGFIREGTVVRLWGAFDARDAGRFQATSIQGGRMGAGHDPTGVRGRIGREKRRRGGGPRR